MRKFIPRIAFVVAAALGLSGLGGPAVADVTDPVDALVQVHQDGPYTAVGTTSLTCVNDLGVSVLIEPLGDGVCAPVTGTPTNPDTWGCTATASIEPGSDRMLVTATAYASTTDASVFSTGAACEIYQDDHSVAGLGGMGSGNSFTYTATFSLPIAEYHLCTQATYRFTQNGNKYTRTRGTLEC